MIRTHHPNEDTIVTVVNPISQERTEYTWDEYFAECVKARNWQRALENAIEIPAVLAERKKQ